MNVSVIGLGQRGFNYIRWIKYFCKDINVIAVCDKNADRADYTANKFNIPNVFYDENEFFEKVAAEAIIVATQDRDHIGHCLRAIDAGYKFILVEKPVSPIIEECERLNNYAEAKNVSVVVCHVLRYTKYYRTIKKIITNGDIGDVVNIQHCENVGYFHFAHSFVRGNWPRENETSPFILAKCCHDFDILQWLIEKPCVCVSSFGSLKYFKSDYAPVGAAERCLDCDVADCKYNAEKLYITDSLFKATFLRFSGSIITGKYKSGKKDKYDSLKSTDYGKCVFKCDNNVVDHQIVNILYEDGITATHTVNACTDKFFRKTTVTGTKGEIIADDYSGIIKVNIFGGKHYMVRTKLIKGLGHVDGDINLIKGWCRLICGKDYDPNDITFLSETITSHRTAIYADLSMKENGKSIRMDEKF